MIYDYQNATFLHVLQSEGEKWKRKKRKRCVLGNTDILTLFHGKQRENWAVMVLYHAIITKVTAREKSLN